MKKVALAALLLLAFGLPFLGWAEAATQARTHGTRKRHSTARHHTRKSTTGPKRSHTASRGRGAHTGPRAHARSHARAHARAHPHAPKDAAGAKTTP